MTKKEDWNEKSLKDNEPRLYRFQQIESLLKAFDIKGGIETLNNGYLNEGKRLSKQNKYLEDFKENSFIVSEYKRLSDQFEFRNINDELKNIHLFWLYFIRLAYISYSLMKSDDIKRDGFIGELCMDIKQQLTNGSNKEQIQKVFRILGIVIDPLERKISKEELIKKFKFPDVDLKEIDVRYY